MAHKDHTPKPLRRKRSARLSLAMMGASAFGLTACGEPERTTSVDFDDANSYKSVEECVADNIYTESACEDAYKASMEDVPRYSTLEACEAENGEGACTAPTEQQAQMVDHSGGGDWFMPAMMGYMVGNMMSRTSHGATNRSVYQEPVYRNRQNQGNWNTATSQANQRVSQRHQSMTQRAAQNRSAMSRSSSQRSGFGSRSSARGGWGS